MKLQVTQENLAKALNSVAKVANTRSTLPVLSNVLLKTVGTRLSVAATNLDIAITHYIGSKVEQAGAITVPARLTQEFVSSLPSGVIDISQSDNHLSISTGKYESTINGIVAEDYPVMPKISKGETWTIGAADLKKALQEVVLAASSDDARPVLTGVYFHSFNGYLYATATDSYRLAEKKLLPQKSEVDLLVPANAMQDLLRIIADYEDEVVVEHDDQQVSFKAGDVELVARLIEGNYPDYRKLIPKSYKVVAKLKKAELTNIAKVSSLFARESAGSITIKVSQKDGLVSIRSIASQLGENTASADGEITGDGEITLNSRYLLDALHVIDSPEVEFCFNAKLEPSAIKPTGSQTDYLHIIMPLKS